MLGFFTTKVMAYICAALGIAVLAMGGLLWAAGVRIDDVKNDRDKARNQVVEALKTIKGQEVALKECSDKTLALKAESDKKAAAADQALARARQEASRYQQANQKRDAALKAPTPAGAGCSQAIATLRPGLGK